VASLEGDIAARPWKQMVGRNRPQNSGAGAPTASGRWGSNKWLEPGPLAKETARNPPAAAEPVICQPVAEALEHWVPDLRGKAETYDRIPCGRLRWDQPFATR